MKKPSVSEDLSEEGKASRAKKFLADMKKSLSQVSFDRIIRALQTYKKTDNLDHLLTETAILSEDTNTQSLLHGKSSALINTKRPEHSDSYLSLSVACGSTACCVLILEGTAIHCY